MSNPDLDLLPFGFRRRPFSLQPDPDFLFWTAAHKKAYSVLEYGVMMRAPITLLTGEIGAGKTTLVRRLIEDNKGSVTIGLVSNTAIERREVVPWVMNALNLEIDASLPFVALFQKLQDFLISEYAAGRRVVVIFDEAQNMGRDALEELRMLTNINSGTDELLQLVLVGQPELNEMIQSITQFAQRVSVRAHLDYMARETMIDYVKHRLRFAGGMGDEFTDRALHRIHRATGGVPRLVNQICEMAMTYAFAGGETQVDDDLVKQLIDDDVLLGIRHPKVEKVK